LSPREFLEKKRDIGARLHELLKSLRGKESKDGTSTTGGVLASVKEALATVGKEPEVLALQMDQKVAAVEKLVGLLDGCRP
jgi:hypothetical protein